MDKLYVASILRTKILSTFVMLQELERSMIQSNRQQATAEFIDNNTRYKQKF